MFAKNLVLSLPNGASIEHAQDGRAKRVNAICPVIRMKEEFPEASGVEITTYGQDVISTLQLPGGAVITCLADGHGDFKAGSEYSKYSSLLLPVRVAQRLGEISSLVHPRQKLQLSYLMHDIFKELDDYLLDECPATKDFNTGGTTMTVNVKFPHPTQKWKVCSVTSNIGDSPMYQVRPGKKEVIELTECINGDTKTAYKMYIEECLRNGVEPKEVWLSRCNSGRPGSYRAPWVTDEFGKPRAIKVFDYEVDAHMNVTVTDHPDVQIFYEKAADWMKPYLAEGGTQALRGRAENVEAIKRGEFPSSNFGSTLEWGVQNLSSFGDKDSRPGDLKKVLTVHTQLDILDRTTVTILCSDGFSDVVTDEAMLASFQRVIHQPGHSLVANRAAEHLEDLWASMMETARTTASVPGQKHKLFPMGPEGSIKWDDVSVALQITTIKPPKKNKNRRRKRRN